MKTPERVGKVDKWGSSSRFYQVGEKQYPSVTTILSAIGKPALINWAAKMERELVTAVSADLYEDCPSSPRMSRTGWITSLQGRLTKERAHQKELAKAGEIGSQVHALIEWTLRASLLQKAGPSPRISEKAQWAFMAWEDWRQSVNLKPVFIEQAVWSDTHGYAGTLDLLAEINGELTVLDWKTGKGIYREAYLQNAAYRHALREMGHATGPLKGMIVRLPKVETDPEFEARAVEEPEEDLMAVFLNVMHMWSWLSKAEQEALPAAPGPVAATIPAMDKVAP